jgi:hypothetical protein
MMEGGFLLLGVQCQSVVVLEEMLHSHRSTSDDPSRDFTHYLGSSKYFEWSSKFPVGIEVF